MRLIWKQKPKAHTTSTTMIAEWSPTKKSISIYTKTNKTVQTMEAKKTLRDEFAISILSALISHYGWDSTETGASYFVKKSYETADAMLNQRTKQ